MEATEKTTEDLINEILEGQKDAIKANLISQIKSSVSSQMTYSLQSHIGKLCSDFVEKEMSDDIKKLMEDSRPIILEHLKSVFVKIGANVATAMYETAAKNLTTNTWQVKEILKKLVE